MRVQTAILQLAQLTVSGNILSYSSKDKTGGWCGSSDVILVYSVDSGDCAAQGVSGVSDLDVPGTECAAVGPVLARKYLYHGCGYYLPS